MNPSPRSKCYDKSDAHVKEISDIVPEPSATIDHMAKGRREKLPLPPDWLALVTAELASRGMSRRALARAAKVSAPSITRMYNGEGSWDTVMKVARALAIDAPELVMPGSHAARIDEVARTDPQKFRIITSLLNSDRH